MHVCNVCNVFMYVCNIRMHVMYVCISVGRYVCMCACMAFRPLHGIGFCD